TFEPDETGNAENDGARAFTFYSGAEAAANDWFTFGGVIVFEIGHFEHAATAPAAGESAIPLGRWKSEGTDLETPDFAFNRLWSGRVKFVDAPEVVGVSPARRQRSQGKAGLAKSALEFG